MKRFERIVLGVFVLSAGFSLSCLADTFTHHKSGENLYGYVIGRDQSGQTVVQTQQKGRLELNSAEWEIAADRRGRNNKVIVLTLDGGIALEIETAAMERAMVEVLNEGPLFILLELDTPGGRSGLARRICAAITKTGSCEVIAFVKGGKYGGAISAGAAVALACDKIYMANNSVMGAATTIAISESGRPQDLKEAFGEAVAEKFSSFWRAYLASLAEQNGRSGLLARAMADKDIEVVEVLEARPVSAELRPDRQRLFIDPVNKKPQQKLVRSWSEKGSLLTLTAAEAVKCGIADKLVDSREALLRDLGAADAEIVVDDSIGKAARKFKVVELRFSKLKKSIDLQYKHAQNLRTRPRALKILRKVKSDYKALIRLARQYPDLHIDVEVLEEQLNSVEATLQQVKMDSRRRRRR